MNLTRLSKLSNLVTNDLKRKPTIMLQPDVNPFNMTGTADNINVNLDAEDWNIPESLEQFVKELALQDSSMEEKILVLYEKLCEDYTYDDNVLSYIKKNDDETFFLPDQYGRVTTDEWKEKRKEHNRRNCFEISRILAKLICRLIKYTKTNKQYDVCILWDEAVTHYLVGFASNEYYLALDLDDFTQIKDLTRIKMGLTAEGIKVLEDTNNKFTNALAKFNEGRAKIAKDFISEKVAEQVETNSTTGTSTRATSETIMEESDDALFIKLAIQVLKEKSQNGEIKDIGPAGIFEFMKEIIDTKIGARARKKIWTEVQTAPGTGKPYTRCLIVKIDDIDYVIDVTKDSPDEIFRKLDPTEISGPNPKFIPFSQMKRDWETDPYDGR